MKSDYDVTLRSTGQSETRLETSAFPRYLTLKQAAAYLCLSTKSLYRLVDSRRIPFTAISVSPVQSQSPKRIHYRFDRFSLDAFMARNAVVPPAHLLGNPPFRQSK